MSRAADDERSELVRLVRYLMSGQGTESEQDAVLAALASRVPHPRVADLIFWPATSELGRGEVTPEEVVDAALDYRPFEM